MMLRQSVIISRSFIAIPSYENLTSFGKILHSAFKFPKKERTQTRRHAFYLVEDFLSFQEQERRRGD